MSEKQKAAKLLLRPSVNLVDMLPGLPGLAAAFKHTAADYLEQAEIQIKYDRYIVKEQELVEKMSQMEDLIIPDRFDYDRLQALSSEARQKFKKVQPRTIGQAGRISGVNPSDIQILMVYMGR